MSRKCTILLNILNADLWKNLPEGDFISTFEWRWGCNASKSIDDVTRGANVLTTNCHIACVE